jgi:hypothetical protein
MRGGKKVEGHSIAENVYWNQGNEMSMLVDGQETPTSIM